MGFSERSRVRKGNRRRRTQSQARPETKRKLQQIITFDDFSDEDEQELIPPPFPRKLFRNLSKKQEKGDPPSSPTNRGTPSNIQDRSHSLDWQRSPILSSQSKKLKKMKTLPSLYSNRRPPNRADPLNSHKSYRRQKTFTTGIGNAEITALNDQLFGESKRDAATQHANPHKEKTESLFLKRVPSGSSRYSDNSLDHDDFRGDSPDTVTTITSSDANINIHCLDKTIIGKLSRRYSFANVYQCKRGNVVFKLAFHSSPFTTTDEDMLSNVKKLFQFASLSIDYEGFECSLLEPIRRLNVKRSYSDFENLKLEIHNYHDGTLSGRFTGFITSLRSSEILRKVHIPLDIQFHCTIPSRDAERLAELLDHPSFDIVE